MKNQGVILEEPTPQDYMVGANTPLIHDVIFSDGHGIMEYITAGEFQKKAFESMGCVSMSANHNTQIIKKIKYGVDENESDRYVIVGSGTTPSGNGLNTVAEFKRKKSFVLENEYPWPDNIDRNTFFQNIPNSIYKIAEKNSEVWLYNHEWLTVNINNIIDSLKLGKPVQATITQWEERGDGINYSTGSDQIHAINIVDYEYGKYWRVYDQYNDDFVFDGNTDKNRFIKKFDWDFPFGTFGKVYTVTKKKEEEKTQLSLINNLKRMFENLVAYMDDHGLHIWYIDKNRGKQEIPLTSMFEKALAMSYVKQKVIKSVVGYAAIAGMPNVKIF